MRFLYKFVISCTKDSDEEVVFHHFFCMITITNAMTNTENRDFVSIFSRKGLISNLIMVKCLEFTKLTMRFHLLLAAKISGWRARCLKKLKTKYVLKTLFITSSAIYYPEISASCREKIEDYLRFLTHAGETRFPIFAWESLPKLGHFVNRLDGALTLTLELF